MEGKGKSPASRNCSVLAFIFGYQVWETNLYLQVWYQYKAWKGLQEHMDICLIDTNNFGGVLVFISQSCPPHFQENASSHHSQKASSVSRCTFRDAACGQKNSEDSTKILLQNGMIHKKGRVNENLVAKSKNKGWFIKNQLQHVQNIAAKKLRNCCEQLRNAANCIFHIFQYVFQCFHNGFYMFLYHYNLRNQKCCALYAALCSTQEWVAVFLCGFALPWRGWLGK